MPAERRGARAQVRSEHLDHDERLAPGVDVLDVLHGPIMRDEELVVLEVACGDLESADRSGALPDAGRLKTPGSTCHESSARLDLEQLAAELRRSVEDPGLACARLLTESPRLEVMVGVEERVGVLLPVDPLQERLRRTGPGPRHRRPS